jgi:predicted metal-binding membrane protein
VPSDGSRLTQRIGIAALIVVTVASWILLFRSAATMTAMRGDGLLLDLAAMMRPLATGPYLGATALMWIVMMSAMMTPAVLPVVLVFERLDRGGARRAQMDGVLFATGYLLVWIGFALAATLLQWTLHRSTLLHGHALSAGPRLAGALLVVAGIYQLTPLKTACLRHCRTPLAFLLGHWQEGPTGALRMGIRHGRFCLGCCWALMLLMFVGGVMSVGAMAVLSAFILAERVLPAGPLPAKLPGLVLLGWGAWTLVLCVA